MEPKLRSRIPAAIVGVALVLGLFLLGMVGFAYWLVQRASNSLVHGQAAAFMAEASRGFRSLGRPPRSADAERFLDTHRQDGLFYIAIWRPEDGITAAAGDTPASIDNTTLAEMGVARPVFVGSRVRIKLGPPEPGRPRREGPPDGPPPWEGGPPPPRPEWGDSPPPPPPPPNDGGAFGALGFRPPRPPPPPPQWGDAPPPGPDSGPGEVGPHRPPPYIILEFEPIEAQRLSRFAQLNLVIGLIVAAAIFAGAAFLVHLIRRQAELAERVEHGRRLAALGEMAAVIAHEIRNPLTALKGHAQLLQRMLTETKSNEKAGRVVTEAVRLETLLTDLLEFARTGAIEPRSVDPSRVLQDCADAVGAERIVMNDAEAPSSWSMDPSRMQRVLTNVLRNALQMSPDGTPVEASVFRDNGHLVYEVRDHGPGIPPGEEDKIFEPFYTRKVRGTGLGLSLAQRIVGQHHGSISARNHPDGGAVFRIALESL